MQPLYRPIERSDLEEIAKVFVASLNRRHAETGLAPIVDLDDARAWNAVWQTERRPLFEHISAHAGAGWLAEVDGKVAGYARSIQREDVCQLTELFVHPEMQRAGLGRMLVQRAFDSVEGPNRIILANDNPAALSRYMRAGVYPVCAIFDLERKARSVSFETDLEIKPMSLDAATTEALQTIDTALLGFARPEEHGWLGKQRNGFMFARNGSPVGYAYVGRWNGPITALEANDIPAILSHTESIAAQRNADFGLMVPLANRSAMLHLVDQGFKLDTRHTMYFMANFTPPALDRYIFSMPGFFV